VPDRLIRITTALVVVGVAVVAAIVSYEHAYALVRAHGEDGWTARLVPLTVDGLIYSSSMVMLQSARRHARVPALALWLLGLGILAQPQWLDWNVPGAPFDWPIGHAIGAATAVAQGAAHWHTDVHVPATGACRTGHQAATSACWAVIGSRQELGPQDFQDALAVQKFDGCEGRRKREVRGQRILEPLTGSGGPVGTRDQPVRCGVMTPTPLPCKRVPCLRPGVADRTRQTEGSRHRDSGRPETGNQT
jgi:Protein of unknown function (DUF2637)